MPRSIRALPSVPTTILLASLLGNSVVERLGSFDRVNGQTVEEES